MGMVMVLNTLCALCLLQFARPICDICDIALTSLGTTVVLSYHLVRVEDVDGGVEDVDGGV